MYIENGYHTIARVPIAFVKEDIKIYFEREGIKQHLPYGLGRDIVIKLTKLTDNKYKITKAKIRIDDLDKLPPWAKSIVNTKNAHQIIERQ